MKKKRTIKFTFRMTEEEAQKLDSDMSLAGYHSRSRYIREMLFSRQTRRRYLSRGDANLARQVQLLRVEIKRIGINYNQRVKALNTLARLRDRHGRPVVTAHDIDHDMMDMKKMMQGMVRMMDQIVKEINAMEEVPEDGGDAGPSGVNQTNQ